ncbi:MAG: hypothetical protein HY884_06860 [Deltaproteobacteria bacterium]|nr:hypothetical protein [Deltaproteobacteria bacterium]
MAKKFVETLAICAAAMLPALAYAAETPAPPAPSEQPPYTRSEALKSIMNPHEQINDEGYVLWATCSICHQNTPDPAKEKSIRDVKLRFADDLTQICYRCHVVKMHPAGEMAQLTLTDVRSIPNHLSAPPKNIYENMRIIQKDLPTIMPVEPATGRITCATCHNPHERGVLYGRADYGADSRFRLRSAGLDICQYCHRK